MSSEAGWQPTTCFKKIMKLNKRLKAIYGGSSSGKTYNILCKLYQDAVNNPGETITVASNTLANLKKGAIRDFKNILLSRDAWDYNCWKKSDSIYELNNGSVVEFVGLEDETKARGPRRNRLFIDEANRISFEVYQQLVRRTDKEVLLSWNPSGPFWYNEHVMNVLDHDVLVTNYTDNEALNEAQLQYFIDLEKQSTRSDYMMNEWRVYGLGEWGQTEGACITDYKFCHKGNENEFYDDNGNALEGFQLVGVGLDFGNNDPNAAVALYKDDSHRFIVEEILYQPKMEIDSIFNVIKKYDTVVYADYAWPQTINELNRRFSKIGATSRVLKCKKGPDSIKAGIDLINEVDLYVVRGSNNLAQEFQTYRYKHDKDGNLVDGKYEGPDHIVDALRYVLTRMRKKRTLKIY